jgi:AcrR family transcriptional regulator
MRRTIHDHVIKRHMNFGTGTQRRTYHHGNLRGALIEAALDMIAARGPNGFTLAEVARAVGVSGAAPYRHFRDRNALVGDIARQGFERFATELRAAWDNGRPNSRAAIENCARAYLGFARREPAFYAAMFEPGFPLEDDAALLAASENAFGVLRDAADAATRTLPGPGRPPALMVALHIWSMAHGVASLFIEGPSGARRRLPMPPEDLLEAGLLIYLQSLARPS